MITRSQIVHGYLGSKIFNFVNSLNSLDSILSKDYFTIDIIISSVILSFVSYYTEYMAYGWVQNPKNNNDVLNIIKETLRENDISLKYINIYT